MDGFQKILVLDTAMSGCGAAYYDAAKEACFSKVQDMPRGQSEHIVPFAQDVLDDGGASFEDLDAVVVTLGPGAFTGIRIGVSAAKAFSASCHLPNTQYDQA